MSSSVSKESATIKIQRVLRKFLMRKSVRKISAIRCKVREIEMKINDTETVELIGTDAKERLRVNETLMSLLFKLDSIRGVDFGVRDFRKTVIRKAISLQEKIDSIVDDKNESARIDSENACEITSDHVPKSSSIRDAVVDDSMKLACDADSTMNADGAIDATMEDLNKINVNCNRDECSEEDYAYENTETENKKRNIQILEKLMDDNEKMMNLMKQMFERNEMQTHMLNSLSHRVEQLEKTFIREKSKKKKSQSS
ncbi:hypothetical protein R6Q59_030479 [Mikania micrantha]